MPGQFRISATAVPGPVGLGLSAEFQQTIATAPEIRTPAQRAALLAYRRADDAPLAAKNQALALARQPVADRARAASPPRPPRRGAAARSPPTPGSPSSAATPP